MGEIEATDQMGPDVNRFVVKLKNRPGAGDEGVGWPTVAALEVLVVPEPVWLFLEVGGETFCFGELGYQI